MTRTRRRFIGMLSIAAIVCAQLGLSAHACPQMAPESKVVAQRVSQPASPCEEMEQAAGSPLCKKHCSGSEGAQNALTAVPALPAPSFVIAVMTPSPAVDGGEHADPVLLRATAPPPTIRNCCFRI